MLDMTITLGNLLSAGASILSTIAAVFIVYVKIIERVTRVETKVDLILNPLPRKGR